MPEDSGEIEDDYRVEYLRAHIEAMRETVELDGVELMGYTCWGPIDLVSVATGQMRKRYGFILSIETIAVRARLRDVKRKASNGTDA